MFCFNLTTSEPSPIAASGLHPAAAAVDLSKVRRRVLKEKQWTEERVDAAVAEYRRFATLAAAGVPMPPCLDVDEIWHAHILHTIDYAAFSAALLGPGSFLHHIPADPEDTPVEQREAMKSGYSAGLTAYRERFGAEPHAMWGGELPAEADAECAPCLYKAEDNDEPAEPSSPAPICIFSVSKPEQAGQALCIQPKAADSGKAFCLYRAEKAGCVPCFAFSKQAAATGEALCSPIRGVNREEAKTADSKQAFCGFGIAGAPRQAFCGYGLAAPAARSNQALCFMAPAVQA
ncbi:hypothetical protein DFJ74DRAFT_772074 [Hyaloraphidium curvatum]|nr:hypothetical protein DFJ74DRAFT_772074 [Hyaloraphidium curvatum]